MYYYLITSRENIFYLTGYLARHEKERETFVLLSSAQKKLDLTKIEIFHIVPEMFLLQARRGEQAQDGTVAPAKTAKKIVELKSGKRLTEALSGLMKPGSTVLFEEDDLSFGEYTRIKAGVQKSLEKLRFVQGAGKELEQMRASKTDTEIALITKAVHISEAAFRDLETKITPGVSEVELKTKLENFLKAHGSEGEAFEAIVAFGENSAIPHHVPGARKLKQGDIVLIDWGGKYQNYCADMTRTFMFGKPVNAKAAAQFADRYEKVLAAYNGALSFMQAQLEQEGKISVQAVVAECDRLLGKLAKNMVHSLGHGIGIAVHEKPYFSSGKDIGSSKSFLPANTVVTVEPGVYFTGWGGIRLEKTVFVSADEVIELGDLEFKSAVV